MGAGASAGVHAAVQNAKPEELASVLSKLPEAEREKLTKSLAELGAGGDVAAPAPPAGSPLETALKAMFGIYDLDGSGFITIDENLAMDRAFSKECGVPFDEEEARKEFKEADANKDGKVALKEFLIHFTKTAEKAGVGADEQLGTVEACVGILKGLKATDPSKCTATLDDSLTAMFEIFDLDKSGFVTLDEVVKMDKAWNEVSAQSPYPSGAPFNEAETRAKFAETDTNKDEKVCLAEFIAYFKKTYDKDGVPADALLGFVKQANDMLMTAKVS